MAAQHEDSHLEILIPVTEALTTGDREAEASQARMFMRMLLAYTAQRTMDEDVRVRWFRGPTGREMVRLAGPIEGTAGGGAGGADGEGVGAEDTEVLRLLTEGLTNHEIAERLGLDDPALTRRLGEMFARIGATNRAEATAFAFRESVV